MAESDNDLDLDSDAQIRKSVGRTLLNWGLVIGSVLLISDARLCNIGLMTATSGSSKRCP